MSAMPTFHSRQSGFTLIEVMAAFAVFALMFGVVLQVLSTSMGNTRRAGDYTQAALWAQSKLDVLGLEEMLEPGETSGEFDDRYRWYLRVEEVMSFDDTGVDLAELPVSLYAVELVVEWGENPTREAVFRTLRSVDLYWQERQQLGPMP
ncbi:type IV pilus modification PilV family protein [Wenzhouxiangella marina]|uniref:General secretion protein I n=1 Tax=Wenzhouxiangella marina TaxID=1579979 RepID=A0A0K0XT52_9GAMM|nr:type II secretion system protein [Wenzhouxiangella marina]AKS40868.1 General secretion protein I [Wenzhouxiangella marina]MBB6087742.1 general secretion pathway protein I [Wenzhouxiangella marina]